MMTAPLLSALRQTPLAILVLLPCLAFGQGGYSPGRSPFESLSPTRAASNDRSVQSIALIPEPEQPEWTKICSTDGGVQQPTCFTVRDYVTEARKPMSTIVFRKSQNVTMDDAPSMRIALPHGLRLGAGVVVAAGRTVIGIPFTLCIETGCRAEVQLTADQFEAVKNSNVLLASTRNARNQETIFSFPVSGLQETLQKAPIDIATLKERNERVAQAIRSRLSAKQE